jgi:hypothetical protein
MRALGEDTVRFARGVQARIEQAPVLEEAVSVATVYDLFMDDVKVAIDSGSGAPAPCTSGRDASCPGIGSVLSVATKSVQYEERRCVMVKLPAKDAIELSVTKPDLLELLTGTIVAMPRKPKGRPDVWVKTTADGGKTDIQLLTLEALVRPHHPKAQHELRFRFQQRTEGKDPAQVCLQLTALVAP